MSYEFNDHGPHDGKTTMAQNGKFNIGFRYGGSGDLFFALFTFHGSLVSLSCRICAMWRRLSQAVGPLVNEAMFPLTLS